MSEELEWELQDLFDSGLFAFPIWEHNAARQIVRTLMRRGVLREEVADAIEESTGDLEIWLTRRGKHMVGEWLIAWMNESREEYERYMVNSSQPSRQHSTEHLLDNNSISFHLDSDDEGEGPQGSTREEIQSVIDYLQMENNNSTISTSTEDTYAAPCLRSLGAPVTNNNGATSSSLHSQEAMHLEMAAPPPLPPRKLSQKPSPEAVCAKLEETPQTVFEPKAPICTLEEFNEPLYKQRDKDKITLLCSLFEKRKLSDDSTDDQEQDTPECSVKAPDPEDRDGPGFIYVMTDSYHKYLPWSGEHRYKVASSRQPEKCLTEFKSRNIEIDLIWQVKVQCHLRAIKEVHTCLQDFTIQSNWFKCPLSTIMDIISKIAKKYRSSDNSKHQTCQS